MLRTRADIEELEDRTLAPYAMRSRDTRGRRVPEPPHSMRTCFQRDRDRIIHCAAFRRLEYKTQVFVNHEGDYYRTRLTHTLEAAQVTRTVAQALGLNRDLAEAVALAHDLGHPPFGHAGERVLNALMRPYGGFDHNAQSLRTVDWMEVRYPGFRGLNLSYEVREGIIKHSAFKGRSAATEFDVILYPCLEAQIVDLADEIAYLAHDADDGVEAGMLTVEQLESLSLYRAARAALPHQPDPRIARYQTVIKMIDLMVTDLVTNIDRELARARLSSLDSIRQAGRAVAAFSPPLDTQVAEVKRFMRDRLYRHPRVTAMTERAGRVITRLFESYLADPARLPPHIVARLEQEHESPPRITADYIAGMTDRFALDECRRLYGTDSPD
jgi:dGTPase